MAENSNIEWTDHTVNLWWGCAKVHTGCKNCYAEHLSDVRHKNGLWGEKNPRKRIKSAFRTLNKIQKNAEFSGKKQKVFVGSMMDIFEESKKLSNPIGEFVTTKDLREELFDRIDKGEYDNIIFLFLTKRPQNILVQIPTKWVLKKKPNVWFGTSVSDQHTVSYANLLTYTLKNQNLFLSIEPQISEIRSINLNGIGWVIQGGESGSKKRPFDVEWARTMRSICKNYKVPYFFKQIDKIQSIPEDLKIRQFPKQLKP